MDKLKTLLGYLFIASSFIISSCGGGTKDQEGKSFRTTNLGNHEWMAENLNVNHFRNGDSIPESKTSEEWIKSGKEGKPSWCIIENNPENGKKFGKLYNWFAVNDPRGLAPRGWHVASDAEWEQLINYLGGGVMAALTIRTTGLEENVNNGNRNSFSGLPGGCRNNYGVFYGVDSFGYWWASTELNTSSAWSRLLNYVRCDINSLIFNKFYGLSVRCIRD
jgi:uncharacterized protein (TIGR02145 family)